MWRISLANNERGLLSVGVNVPYCWPFHFHALDDSLGRLRWLCFPEIHVLFWGDPWISLQGPVCLELKSRRRSRALYQMKGGGVLKTLIACNPFNMSHTLLCQYTKLSRTSITQLEEQSPNGEEVMRLMDCVSPGGDDTQWYILD